MAHTVFLSWQADTPNECGRTFVDAALAKALEQLGSDTVVDAAIRDEGLAVDSDTRGAAGSPPIVDTIFRKIDRSAVFLADLTFVATRQDGERKSPNPNVLVEYGWALKSLSYSRILGVMNTAYGEPTEQSMPFDMRHLRYPIRYHLPPGSSPEEKRHARDRLTAALKTAIGTILGSSEFGATLPKPPPPPKFVEMRPKSGLARFRDEGSELGVIETGPFPGVGKAVRLGDGPAMWLRVMPTVDPGRTWSVTEIKRIATQAGRILLPLGWSAFSGHKHIRAEDGFGFSSLWPQEESLTPAVTFAFVTGEIWTVNVFSLAAMAEIPHLEPGFLLSFILYINFLRDGLEVSPPYRWIAGLEGVKGRSLQHGPPPPGRAYMFPASGHCVSESIVAEGVFNGDFDAHLALKKFFELVYDRCGVERSPHLDDVLKQLVEDTR